MNMHSGSWITSIMVALALGVFLSSLSSNTISSVFSQSSSTVTDSRNSVKGDLISLQNNGTGAINWIVLGVFKFNNINSVSPVFNATLDMMKPDGTEFHKHMITDFKLTSRQINTRNFTTFNGTSTITMEGGSIRDVPIGVTLIDKNAVSIWLDPSKINNHFGNHLIYGTPRLLCITSPRDCQAP